VLSVNISAVQLRKSNHSLEQQNFGSTRKLIKPNLVEQIQNVLESSEINPARLKLEITESLALHDIDFTIETLLHLKALGISIAMDDFGTGHSSLAHLKRMPLDQIKIDQSFVRDIVSDNYDQAIVKSMVDMANNIGISIIAEGVENQAQLDVLLNQGCDLFQGFLFGEALPIDEFEQRLMKHGKGEE
jgi:EAL domain-containing protein (putative c-di-GMP-specific phosphodiesterase class I)